MPKRLQIVLPNSDYREIQRIARLRGVTTTEWVRQVLDSARRHGLAGGVDKKLAAVRAAVRHRFPSGNIETMLAEIEVGYNKRPTP